MPKKKDNQPVSGKLLIEFEVTEEDIAKGVAEMKAGALFGADCCPISQAARRQGYEAWRTGVTICKPWPDRPGWPLPDRAKRFVLTLGAQALGGDADLKPFKFRLEVEQP